MVLHKNLIIDAILGQGDPNNHARREATLNGFVGDETGLLVGRELSEELAAVELTDLEALSSGPAPSRLSREQTNRLKAFVRLCQKSAGNNAFIRHHLHGVANPQELTVMITRETADFASRLDKDGTMAFSKLIHTTMASATSWATNEHCNMFLSRVGEMVRKAGLTGRIPCDDKPVSMSDTDSDRFVSAMLLLLTNYKDLKTLIEGERRTAEEGTPPTRFTANDVMKIIYERVLHPALQDCDKRAAVKKWDGLAMATSMDTSIRELSITFPQLVLDLEKHGIEKNHDEQLDKLNTVLQVMTWIQPHVLDSIKYKIADHTISNINAVTQILLLHENDLASRAELLEAQATINASTNALQLVKDLTDTRDHASISQLTAADLKQYSSVNAVSGSSGDSRVTRGIKRNAVDNEDHQKSRFSPGKRTLWGDASEAEIMSHKLADEDIAKQWRKLEAQEITPAQYRKAKFAAYLKSATSAKTQFNGKNNWSFWCNVTEVDKQGNKIHN